LSTVEVVSVSLDGQAIPQQDIRCGLNGRDWSLQDMPRLTSQMWFVLDSGELQVSNRPLQRDSDHDVEVVLALYPPYISGLRRMVRWKKSLRAG
jgi:hypothetical protein